MRRGGEEMLKTIHVVVVIFALVWVSGAFADEHLLFYATFYENVGNVVKDHSDYGNDGEFMNGAVWSPDGKFGGCAEIRENLAHVNVPHNDLFNIEDTITMEAWVNPDVDFLGVQQGMIIEKVQNYVIWFTNTGQLRIADDKGEKLDTVGYPFEAGEWCHVAGILDTKSPRRAIYVDGELVSEDEVAFGMEPTTYPLQIGHKETNPGNVQYKGLIDEVMVWNTVRTEAEIKQDMEGVPEAILPAGKLTTIWASIKVQ
jgi:hypothetical protein